MQGARACLFDESQLAAAEKIAAEAGEISLGGGTALLINVTWMPRALKTKKLYKNNL